MLSPSSSVSSTNSGSHASCSSRCQHQPRITDTDHDDVYYRRRKIRQHSFEQQQQRHRCHSGRYSESIPTDKSMSSSHGSSRRSSRNSDELSLASTCDDRPRLNLPLDKECPPLQADKEKEQVRDHVICMIFDLPESTQFYEDFSCAIASTLAMHGRMYPTSSHVCFYSNVFGRERKILIPYESIREIEKTTTMMFQHSIRLATYDEDEYTFTSFWGTNRDSCYDLIVKTRDRVLHELHPTGVNASESGRPMSPVASNFESQVVSSPPSQRQSTIEEDAEEEEEPTLDAAFDHDNSTSHAIEDDSNETSKDQGDDTVAPRRRSVVSDVDSIAPKDISMTQVLEEHFPVSVDTFMQTYFLDNAPFGMDQFGKQTGSTEMTVNPWTSPLDEKSKFGMTRSLRFRVPIDAPIGPKSSQVDVLQCLKESEHGVRVVEGSTRLVDIPYGDYFSVEDRWTIVPQSSNLNSCKLSIELKVVFSKSTFWKKTIESRAISDNRAKWKKWVGMAKEFLDSRELNEAANYAPESPSTSLEKVTPHKFARKERESETRRRSRSKSNHRHRCPTAPTLSSGRARTASVKVFPWILVLILLSVILHLQMTLSSIELSLLENTKLISDLQRQLHHLATGVCPLSA